jgi:nucleoside-diphosphate-sugar epimerase
MKKILVTGSKGFIGRQLVSVLDGLGHEVVGLDSKFGDIADQHTLEPFYESQIGYVFHLAARTYVPDSWVDPALFQRVNVFGTLNVLELCRINRIPMTHVSAYLYGVPNKLPVTESDNIEPNNPYALSKFLAESLCRFYAENFEIPVTIIRPFNIYGAGQKKHFLIPEIVAQVKSGGAIKLKDLSPRRDYLYVDDLVDALVLSMKVKKGCQVYNIGCGRSFSVNDVVEAIQSEMGASLPVISENSPRVNEISDVYADISSAVKELGWSPRHSFEEGIREMIRKGEQCE